MASTGYAELQAVRPLLAGDIKPYEGIALSNGKVVISYLDGQAQNTKIARLNSDGTLDLTFGILGVVTVPVYGTAGLAITSRANGDLWIAANPGDNSNPSPMQMYQVSANGDTVTHILTSPTITKVSAIAEVFGTGLVYLGLGPNAAYSSGMGLRFIREGGQGGGNSWLDLQYGTVESAAINADGSAVVLVKTGGAGDTAQQTLRLVKFSTAGTVDTSFGMNGQVQFKSYLDSSGIRLQAFGGAPPPQSTGVWIPDPLGVAVDQLGRILVAFDNSTITGDPRQASLGGSGVPYQVTNSLISVARYLSSGVLDTSFGLAGVATYSQPGDAGFYSASEISSNGTSLADSLLSVDSQGRAAIAFSIAGSFRVVRFSSSGTIDTVYQTSSGSQSFSASGSSGDRPMWTAVSSDQGLVVGVVDSANTTNVFSIFKFTSAASIDTSFGIPVASSSLLVCFARGTLIQTTSGPVPVEELQVNDPLSFYIAPTSLDSDKVKWIGRQTFHPVMADLIDYLPVKISANALGPGQPFKDLYISPDHAILFDGTLIHAKVLVNGTSVVQVTEWSGDVEYFHIETENHELIYANGVPAETFIDNVSRKQFDNYAEFEAMYPNALMMTELDIPRVLFRRQL
jgi:uncharacterized delta-60 repeat protein